MSKKEMPVPKEQSDLSYLTESANYLTSQLAGLRYSLKECKVLMDLAVKEEYQERIRSLRQQKAALNGQIKAGLDDQKHVFSLIKKVKRLQVVDGKK